jgi:hypothetical protein
VSAKMKDAATYNEDVSEIHKDASRKVTFVINKQGCKY